MATLGGTFCRVPPQFLGRGALSRIEEKAMSAASRLYLFLQPQLRRPADLYGKNAGRRNGPQKNSPSAQKRRPKWQRTSLEARIESCLFHWFGTWAARFWRNWVEILRLGGLGKGSGARLVHAREKVAPGGLFRGRVHSQVQDLLYVIGPAGSPVLVGLGLGGRAGSLTRATLCRN